VVAENARSARDGVAAEPLLSRTITVKDEEEKAMPALINRMRAVALALLVLTGAAGALAGLALWPADAAQSETRTWIRNGDGGCRYVPVSEAVGALPCQS
jgi:hypothetical protein